ncbi:hypothetical protein [Planobispora takensis]|uniref:Chitinase n=1 Tax=Planobispora takensis TaxID=1367882 RepID=A0A8J3T4T3_9ACTN|nr:hypothetical protein [Planobispora takensis]GII04441.1 hypothetical protein Pta02_64490 [Planobispora takensis]
MRTRRLAAVALVAGGLAFGAMTAPATAASAQSAGSWWFAGQYTTSGGCSSAGVRALFNTNALDFQCRRTGSLFDLYLYHE